MASNLPNSGVNELATSDLGPLAWVLDELRKSLDGAVKALRRFVRDAELARGSNLAELDASQLRIARQQLHQAVGALEIVGLAVPAKVLRAMEALAQKFVQRPELCSEDAASRVERASFALTEYLEGVLKGKNASPVALFPQYRAVADLAGGELSHPADLWPMDWRWLEVQPLSTAEPIAYSATLRSQLDQSVLLLMRAGDLDAAKRISSQCMGLAAGQQVLESRTFWMICAGFFESIAAGLTPVDVYCKRAASKVLRQFATLLGRSGGVSEGLARELLFFCSNAASFEPQSAECLAAVRTAYRLDRFKSVPYDTEQFGRFDPAALILVRKRIATAAETWSALAGGDVNRLKVVGEQFSAVSESVVKIHPENRDLGKALMRAVETATRAGAAPSAPIAMEVATSILYLEAAYDDLDPTDTTMKERSDRLAQRLEHVCAGGDSEPLELWMEELYRRVSDRQTMGSVVDELRSSLAEVERSLDEFFRNTADKSSLREVPNQLAQMRGVFSVLGLDQPALATMRMRNSVEQLILDEVSQNAPKTGVFEKLGNSLGALGFLTDMLSYQRTLAKKLFVYDEDLGEFRPVMGRQRAVVEPDLESTPHSVSAVELVQVIEVPVVASENQGVSVTPQTIQISEPVVAPVSSTNEEEDDESAELIDIFLEEAQEVVQNGLAAVDALVNDPSNLADQTTLRRAFHTLKGSSRMVGLTEFGEAAWSYEQLFNNWLAEQRPATKDLIEAARVALQAFQRWVVDISNKADALWSAQAFRKSSDALRLHGKVVALLTPAVNMPLGAIAADAFEQTVQIQQESVALPIVEIHEVVHTPKELVTDFTEGLSEDLAESLQVEQGAQQIVVPIDDLTQLEANTSVQLESVTPAVALEIAQETPAQLGGFEATQPFIVEASATHAADTVESEFLNPQFSDFDFGTPVPQVEEVVASLPLASSSAAVVPDSDPFDLPSHDVVADRAALPELQTTVDESVEFDAAFWGVDAPIGTESSLIAEVPSDVVESAVDAVPVHDPVSVSAVAVADPVEDPLAFVAAELPNELAPVAMDESLMQREVHSADNVPDALDEEDYESDEQVKIIGELRLSIPLYNVYLNEADEWSRRLQIELSEWVLELNRPLPDSMVAAAHSLAGSSATVGFVSLSAVARELEHAMLHLQLHRQGNAEQARVFVTAAEDIRRLLHQFAAGFMKESDPNILTELRAITSTEYALDDVERVSVEDLPEYIVVPSDGADDIFDSASAFGDVVEADSDLGDKTHVSPLVEGLVISVPNAEYALVTAVQSATVPPITVSVAAAPVSVAASQDDEIDSIDQLDEDLFPIFEEEALELLPKLGSALRQWVALPSDLSARTDVLHVLHTLKGSARLAGAMRLGEMSHRLESSIADIGDEHLQSVQLEPLLIRYDTLQQTFEQLGVHPVADEVVDSGSIGSGTVEPIGGAANSPMAAPQGESVTPAIAAREPTPSLRVLPRGLPASPVRLPVNQTVRVRSQLLDRLVNQAGEVMISRARMDAHLTQLRTSLQDLTGNLDRLRNQLRDVELQSESQMQSRLAQTKDTAQSFDPLEFDRFTRVQELTRMMAESVHDVATVQRSLQRSIEGAEDDLIAQGRQARELQRDLLRTRMVEFESISERLYGVVRQAAKDAGKQVKLDISGGSIELDRGVLERMVPAFEHLLRNAVSHGIEGSETRLSAGKPLVGTVTIQLFQESNDISVAFKDDGGGLHLDKIRAKAIANGVIGADDLLDANEAANLIFRPGFSTAAQVTELSGRGVGMDIVRTEVNALGGRIETTTELGLGTSFKLVLPLTTAVTQVVMLRVGEFTIGVPAGLVETVLRTPASMVEDAYVRDSFEFSAQALPFFWAGALLQVSAQSAELQGKTRSIAIFRSAGQRIAMHVDEVLGNREVVVKNLGPQLVQLPGLAGISVLPSGAVALIYNPVALATVYGEQARQMRRQSVIALTTVKLDELNKPTVHEAVNSIPLILVVDDSITVRRVTQRLLKREGYRVTLASDGLDALEKLQDEKPTLVLSDIEMPRMDGFDLARNIRADEVLRDLPIIMITSRIAPKHREHARELGVDHYLGKPYSEDELLGLIRSYCAAAIA